MRSSADPAAGTSPAPQGAPRCDACGSGHLARDKVRTALWLNGQLVVVEDVPALVCDTCGEQFYEDETAMAIDRMRGRGLPRERAVRHLEVPVFAFEPVGKPAREAGGGGAAKGGGDAPA